MGFGLLLEKKLFLLCFIRPDKTAEKAMPGWDVIRQSLKVVTIKQYGGIRR